MSATARIIVTGKNRDISPRLRNLVVCRECSGDGYVYEHPIDPSARPYRVPCVICDGQGAHERKHKTEPSAASRCLPAAEVGRSASSTVAERSSPSGIKPDAVAATVSRRSKTASSLHTVKRSECSPLPAATPAPKLKPPGDLLDTLQDVVTVASGLIVFCGLAFFLMVIS